MEKNLNQQNQKKSWLEVMKKNLASSILILGPTGVGKFQLAENLGKTILCQNANAPCNACTNCRLVKAGNHPDFIIVKPQISGKKIKNFKISSEQIKKIKNQLNLASHQGGYQVIIIKQGDLLSNQTQNSLLKILEEPLPKQIFILTADSEKGLLSTIVSRCQKIKLTFRSPAQIQNHLKNFKTNQEIVEQISRWSKGNLGLALELIENPEKFKEIENNLEQILEMVKAQNLSKFFNYVARNLESHQINQFLETVLEIFRDLLLIKIGVENLIVFREYNLELVKTAQKYSQDDLIIVLKKIVKIKKYLHQNLNPRLALENLGLEICFRSKNENL